MVSPLYFRIALLKKSLKIDLAQYRKIQDHLFDNLNSEHLSCKRGFNAFKRRLNTRFERQIEKRC